MEFRGLLPGRTDRAAFYGQTGSGKTTLAHYLLEQRPYAVAFDTKGRLEWGPRWHLHRDFKELRKDRHTHLIYRPDYAEVRDEESVERFWAWVYQRENTTAYADEVTDFCRASMLFPFHFGRCITRGRELGISVWSGSQRPAGIPRICLTESETIFAFFLKSAADRDRIEEETGIESDELFSLAKHYFYVAHQSEAGAQGPYTLDLPGTARRIPRATPTRQRATV